MVSKIAEIESISEYFRQHKTIGCANWQTKVDPELMWAELMWVWVKIRYPKIMDG